MKYPIRIEQCKRSNYLYQEIRSRHYIPNHGAVGQQLHYLIFLERECVGIISGGSAAYAVGCRDNFFGITKDNRVVALNGIIDNTVFRLEKNLPNLGTQILKLWRNRVAEDWYQKYGVKVAGFETFIIENDRRKGAMYKADNWTFCGETSGSTKFHQHGVEKQFIRVETEKKLVFCKWIRGGGIAYEICSIMESPSWGNKRADEFVRFQGVMMPKNNLDTVVTATDNFGTNERTNERTNEAIITI